MIPTRIDALISLYPLLSIVRHTEITNSIVWVYEDSALNEEHLQHNFTQWYHHSLAISIQRQTYEEKDYNKFVMVETYVSSSISRNVSSCIKITYYCRGGLW